MSSVIGCKVLLRGEAHFALKKALHFTLNKETTCFHSLNRDFSPKKLKTNAEETQMYY